MKRKILFFPVLLLLLFIQIYAGDKIIYMDPMPGSQYVSINNNIIIGFEEPVRLSSSEILKSIAINGSKSMHHYCSAVFCDDNKKIIIKPETSFNYGEQVTITITGKLLSSLNRSQKEFKYSFTTTLGKIRWDPLKSVEKEVPPAQYIIAPPPVLTVSINNNPSPGSIFSAPWYNNTHLVIYNNNGTVYWYNQYSAFCGDFKKQPNGHLTFYDGVTHKHFELNPGYELIKSYECGNGYTTDIHELRVLENGHALVMAYDPQEVNMSQIVPGGHPRASVTGLIIQEIDNNANVVFQWRSWDHFAITDATHEDLLDSVIDYCHGNAIELDNDGNLMISSRHMDEITKINRATGDIIWRLGGKNNQFTFINDSIRFSYQHAIRRIPNGNITLYDNGNYHTPQFSRAIEYSLDEVNKTVTLVWQFRRTPGVVGVWGGYVQRLPGGNTLIAWGGAVPTITEVTPAGTTVFEASYAYATFTYRAYKFDWAGGPLITKQESNNTPSDYKIYQNFPNPFNPVTKISFDIPQESFTELAVFDVTGRELKKLVSENLKEGKYSAVFDGSSYSSGTYFYRLTSGVFTSSKKMIMIK